MPNGVICGGAVDGSNQLGEIVTCHAMVTRPAGGAAAAVVACRATQDKDGGDREECQSGKHATQPQNRVRTS